MSAKNKTNLWKQLDTFIKQNSIINFLDMTQAMVSGSEEINWKGLKSQKENIVAIFKDYKRLLMIMPGGTPHDIIVPLLEAGIRSAVQIATIPTRRFMHTYLSVFDGDKVLIETFCKNARAIRSYILLEYVNNLQSQEPHITSIKS